MGKSEKGTGLRAESSARMTEVEMLRRWERLAAAKKEEQ